MRIYFAGCSNRKEREGRWLKAGAIKRLISYFLHVENGKLTKDTQVIFDQLKKDLTR